MPISEAGRSSRIRPVQVMSASSTSRSQWHTGRGFTLLELLVVLVLMAVATSLRRPLTVTTKAPLQPRRELLSTSLSPGREAI